LTFFVDAAEPSAYRSCRKELLSLVEELLGPEPPPATVVAQPPETGHVALEARVTASSAADLRVERKVVDGVPYTVVRGRGARQVHGGGLTSADGVEDTVDQATEAFARMEAVLGREGVTFGHVVRQWNYISCMLDVRTVGPKECQCYQAFNDVRTLAYGRSGFPTGYPASTGIGQATGGVVLEFIALEATPDVRVAPLSNPRQVDAHRYSAGVLIGQPLEDRDGKTPPKFERAKSVAAGGEEVVYVSGTAAIVGERSVATGDVRAQAETTIENIAALTEGERLSYLRAYVKRSGDIPTVRSACEAAYGDVPALYVKADICRDELLVEMEGVLVRTAKEEEQRG
ncbi:MAG: chorismate transformation enzyme, FkbO/Hyg5 family, partial [Planctomycetota bacterium]